MNESIKMFYEYIQKNNIPLVIQDVTQQSWNSFMSGKMPIPGTVVLYLFEPDLPKVKEAVYKYVPMWASCLIEYIPISIELGYSQDNLNHYVRCYHENN